jgi:hypothetical protein
MRIAPSLLVAAFAALALPAVAAAAPPANDNYLASIGVANQPELSIPGDTTEATTQADLFNPNRDGQPLGGAGPEPLSCNGTSFGKTVWYDLAPEERIGADISAVASGFTPVVALYEWSASDSKIRSLVDCTATLGESILPTLKAKHHYTIQVGGVGGAGGPFTLKLDTFPDPDGDEVYGSQDDCPDVPGVQKAGGCPPELKVVPALSFNRVGGGISISRFNVDGVPKGAKVVARCGGCGSQTVKAKKAGRVALSKLVGKTARAGATIELRVTLGRTGTGDYRFGATGALFRWPVRSGGLGPRVTKCLAAGTGKVQACS